MIAAEHRRPSNPWAGRMEPKQFANRSRIRLPLEHQPPSLSGMLVPVVRGRDPGSRFWLPERPRLEPDGDLSRTNRQPQLLAFLSNRFAVTSKNFQVSWATSKVRMSYLITSIRIPCRASLFRGPVYHVDLESKLTYSCSQTRCET